MGSLLFNVNGIDSVTLGAENQLAEPDVEITRWTFDRQVEFVGFQVWSTNAAIRAISTISMDKACVQRLAGGVTPTPVEEPQAPVPVPPEVIAEGDKDYSLETAELILICLGGAIIVITILLVSFICYDKCS